MSLPLLKVVQAQSEKLVVVCDKELIGRKLKDGKFQLDVKESFYSGREASVEECIEALRSATVANLLGSIVKNAISEGIIDRNNVLRIQDTLHAQLVRL